MPHWRSMTERDSLGAWDLVDLATGAPKDYTLEIERVEVGVVKSREKPKGEKRPFVYFKRAGKPLVCNATNAKVISQLSGSEDTNQWVGKRVTLYQTSVRSAAGVEVPGIRIRPKRATAEAEEIGDGQPVNQGMRDAQQAGSVQSE
jgi:hypothetical protein